MMDCVGLIDAYLTGMSEGPNFDAAMERRFQDYVEDLGAVVGNDARRRGLGDYLSGLLLPGERKSMEPIAWKAKTSRAPVDPAFRQRSQLEGRPRARAGARPGRAGDANEGRHRALDRR